MPTSNAKLSLLTFPQRWDGTKLSLRILALPKGNPLASLLPNAPVFAKVKLALDAVLIPSLDRLPDPADAGARLSLPITRPTNSVALFQQLANSFNINPNPPATTPLPQKTTIKKYLMPSYCQAFAFDRPRPGSFIDDSYDCALKDPKIAQQPDRPPPSNEVSWGQVIGFVLRQPLLSRQLGLLYETEVSLGTPNALQNGGWLYVDLNSTSDYAAQISVQPDLLSLYAARIPPLGGNRPLFAASLFPVLSGPPPGPAGAYDPVFVEAELYDDGFAKILHGAQPSSSDLLDKPGGLPLPKSIGIRLGWDDEQIVTWMNRQISPDPNDPTGTQPEVDAPMGVFGYRVDVREANTSQWQSLTHVRGNPQLDSVSLGLFDGELAVEALPAQLRGEKTGEYWLPTYFTTWAGGSLVVSDPTAFTLAGREDIARKQVYQPVGAVALRYGRDYEFRVRLTDLSGGGPGEDDDAINPAPAPIARIPFRRFVPPGGLIVLPEQTQANQPRARFRILRPLLGYPDLVYTGFPNAAKALLADLPTARTQEREPGFPDPDVSTLQIAVEVRAPEQSADDASGSSFLLVYTALRPFPANLNDPLELQLDYQDVRNIAALQPPDPRTPQAGSGPLTIPTAREVRLTFTPVCRADPNLQYFGSQEARLGAVPARFTVRAPSSDERQLFVPQSPVQQLQVILLQSDPEPSGNLTLQLALAGSQNQAPSDLTQRLAQQLGLDVSGLTFSSRAGQRSAFGCSSALRHTLAPDRSSITFAAKSDLIRHWIAVIRVQLDRDWTWDGLTAPSFQLVRDQSEIVGALDVPFAVNSSALIGADRSKTDLVFFDAIDPKPEPGEFPAELHKTYSLRTFFREAPASQDAALAWTVRLPVAVPPAQVPKLASAGLALSEFKATGDYSATSPRQRMLWLEFDAPPADPRDKYFARVLGYAPDPMLLLDQETIPDPTEPPLAVDPELVRVITSNQSADDAGLDAMQELMPSSSSGRHFLLPLPRGLSAESLELFGFFVYELRVGHDRSRWTTAQARFGRPLRVTGVHHPVPSLTCQVKRDADTIVISAPYATPIFEGRYLRPVVPRTSIWMMLYAQVKQVDGRDQRNVLLARVPAEPQTTRTENAVYADDLLGFGVSRFGQRAIEDSLETLGLSRNSGLSVLAVELLPEPAATSIADPLGSNLGQVRILRASQLTPVPGIC
jgi:hypothetical protein